MDSRAEKQAEILVEHCTDVDDGENVLVQASPAASPLVEALCRELGARGASFFVRNDSAVFERAYLDASAPDEFDTPTHQLALVEETDAIINVKGDTSTTELSGVDGEKYAAYREATRPVYEEVTETRWCLTQYPTPSAAQQAEMSVREYEDYVWDATNLDWAEQRERQAPLVDALDEASVARLVSGDDTDVRMRLDDRSARSDDGRKNLPGGEVFTSPVEDSVEGHVAFDFPIRFRGEEIAGVRLTFEDGEVVDYSAKRNESHLSDLLATDEGASTVGEFGVGMNPGLDTFTGNTLFDEKMKGTAHLALGDGYEQCGGQNESGIHVDLLLDVSSDSVLYLDDVAYLRDGELVERRGAADE